MTDYRAPIRDMRFVYHELLGLDAQHQALGFDDMDADVADAVLEEAGRFTSEVLAPLNRSGDEEGCQLVDGSVRTPSGFPEAYAQMVGAGWNTLSAPPEYGGQGLPYPLSTLVDEMINASNMAFGMYASLTNGTVHALTSHGSEALQATYLEKLVAGTWSGTMCLTEPHCGTDLALLRTRAVPQTDGSFAITGTKIFISAGDQDLTENIIHLVLARASDAPAGVKGISLFLVPKFEVAEDGSLGTRNTVSVGSLEHKMGIKSSSTCEMVFEAAKGYLVGELHGGLRCMFTMMNQARLAVGNQGLGMAQASYQKAVDYARERLQGRALTGAKAPDKPADPLTVHPDIRRTLLTMRAYVEGGRALAAWIASRYDVSMRADDPQEREAAKEFVALMTPVDKAFLTDTAFEVTNHGLQVFGGHGYIREWGMEQLVRDTRITQIYEGANGIQALDLVGRKLAHRTGRALRHFFHPVQAFIDENADNAALADYVGPLAKSLDRLQRASLWIAAQGLRDPNEAGAAATDYLRLFGLVALAYLWARAAQVAQQKLEGEERGFYQAKLDTARFYMERILPQSGALFATLMSGSRTMMAFEDDQF